MISLRGFRITLLAATSSLLLCTAFASAQPAKPEAPPQFTNVAEEKRFHALVSELRCVMCQNQSLADSNAQIARDLRNEVLELMRQGKSDPQIKDFLVARYGEFVLLKPRFSVKTAILWATPILLLLIGAIAIFVFIRTRPSARAVAVLSAEEQARIDELLKK